MSPPPRASKSRVVFALALLVASVGVLVATFAITTPSHAEAVPRKFRPADIQVASNYSIEPVVTNLSVPSTAIFDGKDLIVAESGWDNTAPPRILRIKPDGSSTVIVTMGSCLR